MRHLCDDFFAYSDKVSQKLCLIKCLVTWIFWKIGIG